ncbi:Uncharacterised protein [Yersinia pseudotuberculosis]|nr:Uncharacterised protein [Yersinia pseudotuberculosis]
MGALRLLTKCPRRREQADRKDAVKYIHVGSSRAILGADALLLCLSSPFKIASSGFVSSLPLFYLYNWLLYVIDVYT